MLFKAEHEPMILEGRKTATRRIWKKPMVKVGGIYKCKRLMFSKDYFAKIRVLRLYQQKLRDMTEEDARKEGYSTPLGFVQVWININGSWNANLEVSVIEFEVIK